MLLELTSRDLWNSARVMSSGIEKTLWLELPAKTDIDRLSGYWAYIRNMTYTTTNSHAARCICSWPLLLGLPEWSIANPRRHSRYSRGSGLSSWTTLWRLGCVGLSHLRSAVETLVGSQLALKVRSRYHVLVRVRLCQPLWSAAPSLINNNGCTIPRQSK
jgi:hypothetical protein